MTLNKVNPKTLVKDAQTAPEKSAINCESDLLEMIETSYARNPNVFGAGDILNITGGNPEDRAGMVAAALGGLALESGERAFQRVVVVLPFGSDLAVAEESIWGSFVRSFERLAHRLLEKDEQTWFRNWLTVQIAANGCHAQLLDLIAELSERTAVIIVKASGYRDNSIPAHVRDGLQFSLIPEDIWAPQVHALAVAAEPLVKAQKLYLALDIDESSPTRPELAELLMSIDTFGVVGSTVADSVESIIAQHVDTWDKLISIGRVGRAMTDVEALPSNMESQKSFLKIQLLHKAGLQLEALALIRSELIVREDLDPSTRVKLGFIAKDAGAMQLASELILPCIDALQSCEDLEVALRVLGQSNQALADRVVTQLEARFPNTESVRRYRYKQLLRAHDHDGAAELLHKDDPQQSAFHARLAAAFSGTDTPNYIGLIQSGQTANVSESYRLASVQDALARGLILHAIELVGEVPSETALADHWEELALKVLEGGFLQTGPDGKPAVSTEAAEELLIKLIGRLAANPMKGNLRIGIVELLGVEVAGPTGLALIAKLVLDLASRPVLVEKSATVGTAGMDWMIAHKPFLERSLNWLQNEQPIMVGKLALPSELLTENPDEAISALSSFIQRAPISDDNDIQALRTYVTLAAALAPHAADPDIDLSLYRLAAGKIVSSNFAQTGRDLVEAAVQAGVTTPRRRRLAWFAVADTYHRSRDYLTAFVALACSFAADDRADDDEIFQQVYLLCRLLRDIGLLDLALTTVETGHQLLVNMKRTQSHGHWLDLLALQVQMAQRKNDDPELLISMLGKATEIGRTVIDLQDQTAPSGIILGQLIRDAHARGVDVSKDTVIVFDELNKWAGGTLKAMIDATSTQLPTSKQLADLVMAIPSARYAEDVGYDLGNIASIAQRAVTNKAVLDVAEDVSFALELLADLGTALPNWDETAAPPVLPEQGHPADIARSISNQGVDILQLGLDSEGRLIRLTTSGGELGKPTVEDDKKFSGAAFQIWSQKFPFCYGIDESPNLYYRTTENLQIGWSPERATIISASSGLQLFPPTILYDGKEFFGRKVPVVAVPSLSWLNGAREHDYKGDGRRIAWISTAESEDSGSTLNLLSQRLDGPFSDHGFEVDTGVACQSISRVPR